MFLFQITEFLLRQNLPVKAMLLLDNAGSHPPAEQLRNDDGSIFTVYMPPNVTPLIQPMDQNAIRLTKLFYRRNLLSHIIGTNEDIGEALKRVSLKDAILNLDLAWKNLKLEVIEKCWHNLLSPLANEVDDEEDIPLSVLRSRIRNEDIDIVRSEIVSLLHTVSPAVDIQPTDVDDWNKDTLLDTKETEDKSESEGNDEGDDVQEEATVNKERVTTDSAIRSINNILQWAEENEDKVQYSSILVLHDLRNTMVQTGLKKQKMQTKITSFFEKKD